MNSDLKLARKARTALIGCCVLSGLASAQVMLERQQFYDPNPGVFGVDLAIDGSNLLLSKEGTCASGTEAAFFFEEQGGTWTLVDQFGPSSCDSMYGTRVALNGSWAFVSAPEENFFFNEAGRVYVYRRVAGQWTADAKLNASDLSPGANFGERIATDGTFLVVGAPSDDTFGPDSGKLYVFENFADNWTEIAKFSASDVAPSDGFGRSVAVDNGRIVASSGSDAAYVFEQVGTNWVETRLTSTQVGASLRGAVAIDGNRLAVGSPTFFGSWAHVFEEQNGSWNETAVLASPWDSFGTTLGLEPDRLVVGASDANWTVGRAYVFEPGASGWDQRAILRSKVDYTYLGNPLAVSGDWVVSSSRFGERTVLWNLDCDANLVVDAVDILNGAPDCDGDTFLDACEIASGSSDLNQDDVPDECQTLNFPYCVGKVNSSFCLPTIGFSGLPSLSDTNPFDLVATDVIAGKNGLLFYGLSGATFTPFLDGTLCVTPPLARTPIQPSGAGTGCGGALTFDFNAWLQNGNDPLVQVSTTVNAQFWYRDPGSPPYGVGLSNAVEFVVGP